MDLEIVDQTLSAKVFFQPFSLRNRPEVDSAYGLWKKNWQSFFFEIGRTAERFESDNFSRQSHFLGLYSGSKCIAYVGYRLLDFNFHYSIDDSYLENWPTNFVESLKPLGKVLVLNGFTIDADLGLKINGLPLLLLFGSLTMKHFLNTGVETMISILRNDVGMNHFSYRYGAEPIFENAVKFGQPVDFSIFRKSKINPYPYEKIKTKLQPIVESIQYFNNKELKHEPAENHESRIVFDL